MGMSTSIVAVRDLRETFDKMWAAKEACEEAGIDYPEELKKYFGSNIEYDCKDSAEQEMLTYSLSGEPGVVQWGAEMQEGYEVDLRKLPKDVKIIRFFNAF